MYVNIRKRDLFTRNFYSGAEKEKTKKKRLKKHILRGMEDKIIDLFRLGVLLPHYRPCDDTFKNSCFQIFKQSRVYE